MVLDLLQLCRQPGEVADGAELTETEAAVSQLLQPLLADQALVKVGFSLATDVERLQWSYPHLPCFKAVRGVVEVRRAHCLFGASECSLLSHALFTELSSRTLPLIVSTRPHSLPPELSLLTRTAFSALLSVHSSRTHCI
jgi:hypothetical protein